jgi:SAM-dependent methyltransferase
MQHKTEKEWFIQWFDTKYYHTLYKHRDYKEASDFIDNITRFLDLKANATCWDLCCGKGRHSIYLNSKGYRVIGTDLSEQSILEAKKNESNSLDFYTQDMRKLFRTNYFDVVFNVFTSFGYFDTKLEDKNVFDSVYKSLKSNGIFVFDFLNGQFVKNNLIVNSNQTIDGISFNISKKIENNTVIKSIDFEDNNQHFHFEERVKLFDTSYFETLAKECNFKILHTFGNYQLEKFDTNLAPRLILVMQKHES